MIGDEHYRTLAEGELGRPPGTAWPVSAAPVRILGVSGSLRRGSFNQGLVRAAEELAPAGASVKRFDLADLPMYHYDVEAAGEPDAVRRWKDAIRSADALLIATPEYNGFMPGVLHNAVDWASRPRAASVLRGKPVAVVGATPGRGGTVRAQETLRQLLANTGAEVLETPRLYVADASSLFDESGNLRDEATRRELRRLLGALASWSVRVRQDRAAA